MAVETVTEASAAADASGAAGRGGGDLWRFLAVKLSGAAVSLVLVVLSAFFIFRVLGGDPLDTMTRDKPATPEQRRALVEQYGLDQPMSVQFAEYLKGIATADFGQSYQSSSPVAELIAERLPATLLLTCTGLALAAGFGLWVGARAGWRQGSRFEKAHVGAALTLWSAPTFWLGMLMIVVFARYLDLFPVNGMRSARTPPQFWPQFFDVAHHLVLPAVTMAAVVYAQYVLIMRSSIIEEKGNDYLTVAKAKGLRDDLVRRRHAVPNALLPTVTLVFLQIGAVFNGALLTETIFSWPGLGLLFYEAIQIPDVPLLQTCFLFFAGTTVVANTVADILYRFLDPRVRTG
ncbi:MAG: ABC transporter permease [Stackebrandtia sp.]